MKRTTRRGKKPSARKALQELRDACNQQFINDDDLSRVVGGVCGWNQTKPMAQQDTE